MLLDFRSLYEQVREAAAPYVDTSRWLPWKERPASTTVFVRGVEGYSLTGRIEVRTQRHTTFPLIGVAGAGTLGRVQVRGSSRIWIDESLRGEGVTGSIKIKAGARLTLRGTDGWSGVGRIQMRTTETTAVQLRGTMGVGLVGQVKVRIGPDLVALDDEEVLLLLI